MSAASRSRRRIEALLDEAGVRVDGGRDWDLQVHDDRLYARLLAQGSLGLGESYMDGWWDARSLDGFLARLIDARLDERVHALAEVGDALLARLSNRQSRTRDARRSARARTPGAKYCSSTMRGGRVSPRRDIRRSTACRAAGWVQ